jgi:Mrp family chromosome partitioning ATPase
MNATPNINDPLQWNATMFQQIVSFDTISVCESSAETKVVPLAEMPAENPMPPTLPVRENSQSAQSSAEDRSQPMKEIEMGDGSTRMYRIDDRHDRFLPSGLLSQSNLHLTVKANPATEQVEVENLLQQEKAIRISRGAELQQIVISTYESISGVEDLPDLQDDCLVNPQVIGIPIDFLQTEWRPGNREMLPAGSSSSPVETADTRSTQSEVLAAIDKAKTVGLSPSQVIEKQDKSETHDVLPLANPSNQSAIQNGEETAPEQNSEAAGQVEAGNTGATQNTAASKSGAVSQNGEFAQPEKVKPAWEVAAFRWPATINKLCSEHRSSFTRLLSSIQEGSSVPAMRLGVLHAVSGQGSTTLAACLAKIIADEGAKVLLADMDIESPMLEEVSNIQLNKGWQELLYRQESINEFLVRDASRRLTLMPLGCEPGLVDKRPELLEMLTEISHKISSQFDYSIFDIGNAQNLMLDENCHVGLLDAVVIVSDSSAEESTAVAIYDKLVAAGMQSVVIAENFRGPSQSAA